MVRDQFRGPTDRSQREGLRDSVPHGSARAAWARRPGVRLRWWILVHRLGQIGWNYTRHERRVLRPEGLATASPEDSFEDVAEWHCSFARPDQALRGRKHPAMDCLLGAQ